jgi:pimeloyl-ACP methyl ester carboxylesterase
MIKSSTILRTLLCLSGVLLTVPLLALTTLAFVTPITVSGGLYLFGIFLAAVGLILAPWRPKVLLITLSGLILILAVAGARLSLTRSEDATLKVIELPSANETRRLNVLIDERDSLLFGEAILHLSGGVSQREHEGILSALSAIYREARAANGVFPSPIMSTYLGLQNPAAFDAIVIEPTVEQSPSVGVLFLHGFMGNVTVQCWQIARAVEKTGAVTVCPSTSWIGDWWQPEGKAIIRATFAYLRQRGIQHIYLGGFSNGGSGVGRLISSFANEPELSGLFFIAGARNAPDVRETNLPVLVIQGINDERALVQTARLFVGEVGAQVTYVELEADHFLIMKEPQLVQEAIRAWLEGQ